MVRKETCPHCKGNRYIRISTSTGRPASAKCPHCAGKGFRVRMVH